MSAFEPVRGSRAVQVGKEAGRRAGGMRRTYRLQQELHSHRGEAGSRQHCMKGGQLVGVGTLVSRLFAEKKRASGSLTILKSRRGFNPGLGSQDR